jgi:long-chain fatty acid transport protein
MMKLFFHFKSSILFASLVGLGIVSSAESAWAGNGFVFDFNDGVINPANTMGAVGLDNAKTIFYNPAGLMRLEKTSLVPTAYLVFYDQKFKNQGSTVVPGIPLSGGDTAKGGITSLTSSLSASWRVADDVALGVSIDTPFGLGNNYTKDWVGRYQAIESRLSTITITPAVAAKLSDTFSVGVGLNLQYAATSQSNAIDFGSLISLAGLPPQPQQLDGEVKFKGEDWSIGFNAGLLYEPSENTRLGLSYRSGMTHTLTGKADFTVPAPVSFLTATGAFTDTSFSSKLKLPDVLSFGAYQKVSPTLALTGQVDWVNWSDFQELTIDFENPAQPDGVEVQNWKDIVRFGVGAIYEPSKQWTFRGGVAYNPSPVPDEFLGPRLPNADDVTLSFSTQYQASENLALLLRYSHIMEVGGNRRINRSVPGSGTLIGEFESQVNVLVFGLNWKF